MPIILASTTLLRIKLNQRINPHNRHTSLHGTLELLDFTHARLKHARFHTVVYSTLYEVKAIILVALRLSKRFSIRISVARSRALWRFWCAVCLLRLGWDGCGFGSPLAEGMSRAQLGDEFAAIFCCVYRESCGDGEEGGGEGADC